MHRTTGSAVLVFALAAARAAAEGEAPRLQLIQLTGRIEVKAPAPFARPAQAGLPPIPSGSRVRVLAGTAWFESDAHAVVRAKAGDEFLFSAVSSTGGAEPALRIAAGDDESAPVIEVAAGDKNLLLGRGGAVAMTPARSGEAAVEVEKGYVELLDDGQPGRLPAGKILLVQVPEQSGFMSAPLSPFFVNVSSRADATVVAEVVRPGASPRADLAAKADAAISDWPSLSRQTAELMLQKYGPPTAVGDNVLVWDENRPWKRTIVYRTATEQRSERQDVLEQVVTYDVPRSKTKALIEFDNGVKADPERRELSVVSEREDTNFLALNLAHEIVKGELSVTQARALYTKTILLSNAGKSSPSMSGLLFAPAPEDAAP